MTKTTLSASSDLEREYLIDSIENKIIQRFSAIYHLEYFKTDKGFKAMVAELISKVGADNAKGMAEAKLETLEKEIEEMEGEIKWFKGKLTELTELNK